MAKNISLSEEAYERLRREKRSYESFSDVILRLLGNKSNLDDIVGKKLLPDDFSREYIKKIGTMTLKRLDNENT